MADAVATYVNLVQESMIGLESGKSFVELKFHYPKLHELFRGTADFVFHAPDPDHRLHVWDFKYGQGVVVEADHNAQLMYYAAGVAINTEGVYNSVVLHIVQPRAQHSEGPHRQCEIELTELFDWLSFTLIPAMNKALESDETNAGSHCRFCPVRFYKCPAHERVQEEIREMLDESEKKGGVSTLTNEELCRLLDLGETFAIARAAARTTALARAHKGQEIKSPGSEGWKLVKGKSRRSFQEGAEKEASAEWGNRAFTQPEFKSPAQIDKLPGGKEFTSKWSVKGDTQTLVSGNDSRPTINADISNVFTKENEDG